MKNLRKLVRLFPFSMEYYSLVFLKKILLFKEVNILESGSQDSVLLKEEDPNFLPVIKESLSNSSKFNGKVAFIQGEKTKFPHFSGLKIKLLLEKNTLLESENICIKGEEPVETAASRYRKAEKLKEKLILFKESFELYGLLLPLSPKEFILSDQISLKQLRGYKSPFELLKLFENER